MLILYHLRVQFLIWSAHREFEETALRKFHEERYITTSGVKPDKEKRYLFLSYLIFIMRKQVHVPH